MQSPYGPYSQYREQQKIAIQTADRVQLITMLLEGALSYNKKALMAKEGSDHKAVLEYVDCAVKIVLHLYSCLNFDDGGEIADRLGKLYNFVCDQYVVFQKDTDNLKVMGDINTVLETILEGWKKLPKEG